MVICQNKECGAELGENAKFCNECGLRVKVTLLEKSVSVFCPNIDEDGRRCLNPLQKGSKFCDNCGWKIDQAIFQPGSQPCTEKQKNGDVCHGIVGGESKVCSVCGSTAEGTTLL